MFRGIKIIALLLTVYLISVPITAYAQNSKYYSVTVSEYGLSSGTDWIIYVNGAKLSSNNSTIVFLAENGSYSITVAKVNGLWPLPESLSVTVAGYNVSYSINFGPPRYNVTFVESGLPIGTEWKVTFGNTTKSSFVSTVSFSVLNGTYSYYIPQVSGANISNQTGSVVVSGANMSVPIKFVTLIHVTFIETGLPLNSHWEVRINGNYYNSSSSLIVVNLNNGTYTYTIILPSGYSADPRSGEILWNDSVVVVTASSHLGLEIGISSLVIIVLLGIIVHFSRKRKGNN
ncbi:MAG: hypothetical protein AAE975_00845 [Thermoplasmatales archaeon]|jgi:hypothetical protein